MRVGVITINCQAGEHMWRCKEFSAFVPFTAMHALIKDDMLKLGCKCFDILVAAASQHDCNQHPKPRSVWILDSNQATGAKAKLEDPNHEAIDFVGL